MPIAATQTAERLQQQMDTISPYQVITLLLEGALERIDQAKASFAGGENEDAIILVGKTICIVNGLRASLDMDKGGDVALNLDALCDYILARLENHCAVEPARVLDETARLLNEIKSGWDGIEEIELVAACG